jgi:hypothetical protein
VHKIFVHRTIFSLTIRQAVPKFKAVAAQHFCRPPPGGSGQ